MIDSVYRTVQAILNKNNYGVLIPERFNLFAKNAQIKIIDELPDELRRAKNRRNNSRMGSSGYTLSVNQIEDALDRFRNKTIISREPITSGSGFTDYFKLPDDIQFIYDVFYKGCTTIEEVRGQCSAYIKCNPLTQPSEQYPIYERFGNKLYITPSSIGNSLNNTDVSMYYQRLPIDPKWTFKLILGRDVFNQNDATYQDFELPEYMHDRLVVEICAMAGVTLREQLVVQYAQQEQSDNLQQKILS